MPRLPLLKWLLLHKMPKLVHVNNYVTEVKENREIRLAQSVEQETPNLRVVRFDPTLGVICNERIRFRSSTGTQDRRLIISMLLVHYT